MRSWYDTTRKPRETKSNEPRPSGLSGEAGELARLMGNPVSVPVTVPVPPANRKLRPVPVERSRVRPAQVAAARRVRGDGLDRV